MADSDNESGDGGNNGSDREQEDKHRFLPLANVSRIMKKALPDNAQMTKEAREAVQEAVSEFISFITIEANDKCKHDKRMAINGDDLLQAMSTLGFYDYIEPLKHHLRKHREHEGNKRGVGVRPAGGGGPASSSSSILNDVVSGGHGAGFMYGTNTGVGGGGSDMMVMGQHSQQFYGGFPTLGSPYDQYQQHQIGSGSFRSGSGESSSSSGRQRYNQFITQSVGVGPVIVGGWPASSSSSSQSSDVFGRSGNDVGGGYGAGYGTNTSFGGGTGGTMVTPLRGQQFYDGFPTSGVPYQHQRYQMGSSGSGGGSGTGSGGISSSLGSLYHPEQHDQHGSWQLASSSSSQLSDVFGGWANDVGGGYGAGLYGTNTSVGGGDSGSVMGQLYGGSPTSTGALFDHPEQHDQMGGNLSRGGSWGGSGTGSGGGSGTNSGGSSSPSGRQGYK